MLDRRAGTVEREREGCCSAEQQIAKDEFMAMLGHELRNPLAPILTALQLMELRGDATSERERTVIARQVNHLTRLLDDLLDVSRLARGKVELKVAVIDLAEIVARAIEVASPLLERRAHTVEVDSRSPALLVEGVRSIDPFGGQPLTTPQVPRQEGSSRSIAGDGDHVSCVSAKRSSHRASSLLRCSTLLSSPRPRSRAGGLGLGLTMC